MEKDRKRRSKRSRSKQAAITFLTNITLGNENEPKSLPRLHIPTTTSVGSDMMTICKSPESINCDACSLASNSFHDRQSLESLSCNEPMLASASSYNSRQRRTLSTYYDPLFNNKEIYSVTSFNHPRTSSSDSNTSSIEVVEHRKLTRDNSERPIASEKIRKKSDGPQDNSEVDKMNTETSMSLMSVFRYYRGIIRRPTNPGHNKSRHHRPSSQQYGHSYFHQYTMNSHLKHRKAISYGHFLSHEKVDDETTAEGAIPLANVVPKETTYDPNYIENAISVVNIQNPQVSYFSKSNKEILNDKFRKSYPEISISLSKIKSIKSHMLSVGKSLDLEISSVSHSFVYFEKLLLKRIVTKQNRKLIAACCLFLATKVNEPKGLNYQQLFDVIYSELHVSSKDIKNHEFAIFADLEFDLYLPPSEFMPHFERTAHELEIGSIEAYLGYSNFYKTMDGSEN